MLGSRAPQFCRQVVGTGLQTAKVAGAPTAATTPGPTNYVQGEFEPRVAPRPLQTPSQPPPQRPPPTRQPAVSPLTARTPVVLKPNPAASASQPPPAPPLQRVAGPTGPPPSPPADTGRPPPAQAVQARFPVAVLSFFDGIATALHALKTLQVRPVLSWAWELDPEAIKVASSQHPEVVHHGDVFGRSPKDVLAAVSASVPKDTVLLLFAAPPCHDFSRIRSNPPGSSGKEGAKFDQFASWLSEFRQASPFRVVFLVENVVMPLSMQQKFDDKLQCRSFACDSSSWEQFLVPEFGGPT